MDQEEKLLLKKSEEALKNPELILVLQAVVKMFPNNCLNKIRKLNEDFELSSHLAASMRNAAKLAQLFPETFSKTMESKESVMRINNLDIISLMPQPQEKISFNWLGQTCQLSLSALPHFGVNLVTEHNIFERKEYDKLNFGGHIGFILRIDFEKYVLISSLQDVFVSLVPKANIKTSNDFDIFLSPDHNAKRFQQYYTSIYNWFRFIGKAVRSKSDRVPGYYNENWKIKYLLFDCCLLWTDENVPRLKTKTERFIIIRETIEHFLKSVKE